jgi:hypothetical protein
MSILRDRLSQATGSGAAITWALRMDPQIEHSFGSPLWLAENYADTLQELTDAGDELALHTHLWRWDEDLQDWVGQFDDPAWADHCATMGLDAYEEAFGTGPKAHRGGDRFLTGELLSLLQNRGVRVDLTVEPAVPPVGPDEWSGEIARGWLPDLRGGSSGPYHATPESFPAPDPEAQTDPLLIPLSTAPRRRPPFGRRQLYLWEPPQGFRQRLALELRFKSPPVLAFALRSDAVLDSEIWDAGRQNLEHLASRPDVAFVTARQAADQLESELAQR